MERIEQLYWHPKGVIVALPTEASKSIAVAANTRNALPALDATRLNILDNDSILNKRHPSIYDGANYMEQVDPAWREELYSTATDITNEIVSQSSAMGKNRIAVLLFGSVAKMLSRNPNHPDPSNIDIAVIDKFTDAEKEELFDRIRPFRKKVENTIGNNVGVHIHHEDILRINNYNLAIVYIGSAAKTMHDPANIWHEIEQEALIYSFLKDAQRSTRDDLRIYNNVSRGNKDDRYEQLWRSRVNLLQGLPIADPFLSLALEEPWLLKKGRDHFMQQPQLIVS